MPILLFDLKATFYFLVALRTTEDKWYVIVELQNNLVYCDKCAYINIKYCFNTTVTNKYK